jgi:light-regulated signal transduction histidine kinase (bacteriophytochrome)
VVRERKDVEEGLRRLTAQLHNRLETGTEILQLKEKELSRTSAEREQLDLFASLASHDLREPLRKIRVFADLLIAECSSSISTSGHDYLERLRTAVRRMDDLVRDLHRFSKTGAESEPSRLIDLNDTIEELISDLEIPIKEAQADIDVGPLPDIYAGPVQIRELLRNLLSNAIKFRRRNANLVIRVQGRKTDEDIAEIIVQDNGIGFSNEYAEQIFRPFERLHPRSDYEGTGVGLAICQRIVERLGGKITAHGEPGRGATFTIIIPRQ